MLVTESKHTFAFSKDEIAVDEKGRFLATADDNGDVCVYELQAQRLYKKMRSIHKNQWTLAADEHAASLVISAGLDRQVIVWDASRGSPSAVFDMNAELQAFKGEEEEEDAANEAASANQLVNPPLAHTVATSQHGRLLAAGIGNGDILLWRSIRGKEWQLQRRYTGHRSAVACVEFVKCSPGLLLSGGNDGQLALWSADEAETAAAVDKPQSIASSVDMWQCESFDKINWLTTGDWQGQGNVFVSGTGHASQEQGTVAIYTLA
ncbi:WD40-repeat-containing domain protein [Syncephalis pseudoplumigaleata]|uniref:WD40-repeat-containing domain protein n=1 Tax=Syncephalis pseudoplumigaleata TaxID=1712513 RepID=A0A4P9Z698_9FUNG|nr:WD40-repeat-containing domain protein [Syncephalis pseudoplumigaleata]|eukprot:RKP27190.1 WD40-repeat-containing domain protein [Syncephalis pseudoplumigaleata]